MATFRFKNVTHDPVPVDHKPFDFLIDLVSNGPKKIRFTFTLNGNIPYVFTHKGGRKKKFSEIRPIPHGESNQPFAAKIDGPSGQAPVSIRGTNTSNPQDTVPSGTVVEV